MANPVWLGARRIAIKPDGVQLDYQGDRLTGQITYAGPHEMLLAQRPSNGASVSGFGDMKVDRSVIRKSNAPGMGEMDVFLSDDSDDDTEASGKPITEIYWLEQERDLLLHPRYKTGGDKPLTNEDIANLALWEVEQDAREKRDGFFHQRDAAGELETESTALSENAYDYALKRLRGVDSYSYFYPVAALSTFSRSKPATTKVCGVRIAAKPFAACPDGYEWLRTADRHTRSGRHGKWARTQTLIGALVWDHDLYEAE